MEINYYTIGERIRHYREENGLSQEELADIIGVSWRHFNYLEHGERKTSIDNLVAIANALKISSNELLVDYLETLPQKLESEVIDLMNECTLNEKAILVDMLKHLKQLLSEYGI